MAVETAGLGRRWGQACSGAGCAVGRSCLWKVVIRERLCRRRVWQGAAHFAFPPPMPDV